MLNLDSGDRIYLVRALAGNHISELAAEQQVATEAEDASQACGSSDTRHKAHSTALRETTKDNALGRNALLNLLCDQRVDVCLRARDTSLILVLLNIIKGHLLGRLCQYCTFYSFPMSWRWMEAKERACKHLLNCEVLQYHTSCR